VIHFFFQDSFDKVKKQHLFETKICCDIINVFIVTFNKFNAPLLDKSINLFIKIKKNTDPKVLNGSKILNKTINVT